MKLFTTICFASVLGALNAKYYFVDKASTKLIHLLRESPFCEVFYDRYDKTNTNRPPGFLSNICDICSDTIQKQLADTSGKKIRIVKLEKVDKFEEKCQEKQMDSMHKKGVIYPGTKWCGAGDIADNYTDLGIHTKEDTCCREHDHCTRILTAGQCEKELCNWTPFTRSHCDCDLKFQKCLSDVNTETANTIGSLFFNLLRIVCFEDVCDDSSIISSNSTSDNNNGTNVEGCSLKFRLTPRFQAKNVTVPLMRVSHVFEGYLNNFLRKIHLL